MYQFQKRPKSIKTHVSTIDDLFILRCFDIEIFAHPPEGRTFLAQWEKFWTSCLDSGMRKNELKIEIQMKFCRVYKILLHGCQKKGAWSDPTRVKM